jgi:pyruvate-formate lyase
MTMAIPTRIHALLADVQGRKGSFLPADASDPFLYDKALQRAQRPHRSIVQIQAGLLAEVVDGAPIAIYPGWRLAGEHLAVRGPSFGMVNPAQPRAALGLPAAEEAALERLVRQWADRRRPWPLQVGDAGASGLATPTGWGGHPAYWALGWIENHSIRDYAKVLRLGFAGIRAEVEAHLAAAELPDPAFPQQENFWRAALSVCDAGIRLGQRYADLAECQAAAATAPADAARLRAMADRCRQVPAQGARTFPEALQALWLAHILTGGEDGINANSLGRLDQILFPYYRADLAAGRLTPEEAREWLAELGCKLYLEYDVQAITLGGVDSQGQSAVNELSYLLLDATEMVGVVRDLSVRLTEDTPPAFLQRAAELIVAGGGIPFLFNDACFIPALVDHGITLEDARDYAPIGCVELTIPGKANPHAVSGWFNAAKCLELALFDGVDPLSGERLGPATGMLTDFASYEALWQAYCRQVEVLTGEMVYRINRGELLQREAGPLPCWSTLTDACIVRGRDITDGGALYNYHSVCLLGTANTADSLMALKRLVFEERRLTAGEVVAALRVNFADCDDIRQQLLRLAPKYGNDQDEVDALACQVNDHFISLMDGMRSPLNGRYVVHLFSFLCNLAFGQALGATPDGRLARDPIAYSLSAQQGRDESGVTAMLASLARLPHQRAAGGSAAIIDLDPQLVAGPAGVARLVQLIRAACAMGVGQLQWNVTTVERLRQAQQDPDRYGNLPVRVAGYSQMFKLLSPELQEHVIARTKHQS